MLELGLRRWKDFYSQGNGLEETQKRGPELDQSTVAGARGVMGVGSDRLPEAGTGTGRAGPGTVPWR